MSATAIRHVRPIAARLSICALAGLTFLMISVAAQAQQAFSHVRSGTLTRGATVDLLAPSGVQNLGLTAPENHPPRGARLLHPKNSAAALTAAQFTAIRAAPPSSPAEQAAPGVLDVASPRVLQNFDGVSSLDSAVTNFGLEFEPPDQGLCVGNGFVVEPVNSAFTIYRHNGAAVAGPFNVNVLFDEGLTQYTSDPRCYYDSSTHTWFATILFISADNTEARTDIAVNSSGDPTTPWTVYHLEATDDGTGNTPVHAGCPCFGDQPLFGIDGENIYVSTHEFSILGPQTNGAQIYAISKRDLIAGAAKVHFVQFENLTIAGDMAFSVQPAITQAERDGDYTGDAEYFLQSIDPAGTFDNRLGVWALTHREAVSHGKMPTLTHKVITAETFGVPPNAVQEGSASLLSTGDDRMQQVQYIDGDLWGELTTAFNFSGDPTQLSANAWFKIHPTVKNHTLIGATVAGQGYVASAGNFLFYPAIQASPEGGAAMVFTLSGPSTYPSAAYARLSEDEHAFGPIRIAALGSGPYSPASSRWGDYSFAIVDPNGESIWLATEYIPALSRQTVDGLQNWGTRVIQLSTSDDD